MKQLRQSSFGSFQLQRLPVQLTLLHSFQSLVGARLVHESHESIAHGEPLLRIAFVLLNSNIRIFDLAAALEMLQEKTDR